MHGTNADFTAGNLPIADEDLIENVGVAIFKKDKFVGELTGLDSICHLIITNELDSCTFSVPNPFEENKYIDLRITSNKKTKCNVNFTNSSPVISIDVYLIGYGLTLDDNIDYSSEEKLSELKSSSEKYITEKLKDYLYTTSEKYESDICGFGKYAMTKYLTIQEWNDSKWLDNYKYSSFDVNVHLTIKSGNMFANS